LYSFLAGQPDVRRACRKEVHYFDKGPNYARGAGWYRAHFPLDTRARHAMRGRITGEATPFYLFHPYVPARVAELLPDVRLLAILRNPVDRAISGYHHAVRRGVEQRPMDVVFSDELAGPELQGCEEFDDPDGFRRDHSHLARGRYAEQLERWFDCFPREQILLLDFASLSTSSSSVLTDVCAFLGLRAGAGGSNSGLIWHNRNSYAPADADVRAWLSDYFRPQNERLWALLRERWNWETGATRRSS
jgi:hypothetical protein